MKFVYATDIHGDTAALERLTGLACRESAEVVLLGGDLFVYSRSSAPQLAFAEGPLLRFLECMRSRGIQVITVFGNVDLHASVRAVREFEADGLIRCLDLTSYRMVSRIGPDVTLVGYSYVPPTPARLKENERRDLASDRYGYDGPLPFFVSSDDPESTWVQAPTSYLDDLPSIEENLGEIPEVEGPLVLVAHSPPRDVVDRSVLGVNVGSVAVRRWIERRQPVLSLHGHIHEAAEMSGRWAERLGNTICVNPGAAGDKGLQAVVGDLGNLPGLLHHTVHERLDL